MYKKDFRTARTKFHNAASKICASAENDFETVLQYTAILDVQFCVVLLV